MYKDDKAFSLKRKKQRFIAFKNEWDSFEKKPLTKEVKDSIKNLYLEGKTQKEIHILLNMPFSTVRGVVQRLRKKGIIT